MEGCREEKKFCGFEQRLALKKNIYSNFDGRKSIAHAIFFPPKDLVYISINTRLDSRAQTFFSFGQPSIHKKSREISHQKTQLFLTLFEMETKKHILFFPLIDLVLFMQVTNSFQKRTVSPTENLLLLFHHDIVRKKQAQSFFINYNALIDS